MPALTQLRFLEDAEAVPLLVLGTERNRFWCDRSVAVAWATSAMTRAGLCCVSCLEPMKTQCAGGGRQCSGKLRGGTAPGPCCAMPLPPMRPGWCAAAFFRPSPRKPESLSWLLELASMAITDADGTVRVSGAEVLGRLVRGDGQAIGDRGHTLLRPLPWDADHRGRGRGAEWIAARLTRWLAGRLLRFRHH